MPKSNHFAVETRSKRKLLFTFSLVPLLVTLLGTVSMPIVVVAFIVPTLFGIFINCLRELTILQKSKRLNLDDKDVNRFDLENTYFDPWSTKQGITKAIIQLLVGSASLLLFGLTQLPVLGALVFLAIGVGFICKFAIEASHHFIQAPADHQLGDPLNPLYATSIELQEMEIKQKNYQTIEVPHEDLLEVQKLTVPSLNR